MNSSRQATAHERERTRFRSADAAVPVGFCCLDFAPPRGERCGPLGWNDLPAGIAAGRRAGGRGRHANRSARIAADSGHGGRRGAASAVKVAISPIVERMLGLRIDLRDFYRLASQDSRLAALAERFRGMRPPRFPTVFEALINGIACQQMSLTLGIQLLTRMSEAHGLACGEREAAGHAFPRPEDLAALRPEALRPLGFSHQKSRAMIEAAQAVCGGQVDLESLVDVPDKKP